VSEAVDGELYRGRFLSLHQRGHWEYASRPNAHAAVAIIACTAADEVVLVEQYRIPVAAPVIELPAGLVGDEDAADTVLAAAARELVEETGFAAEHLELVACGPPSAGLSDEVISLVRARGLARVGAGGGVAGEDITVHLVPCAEIAAWLAARVAAGVLVDPKVYAGLWWLAQAE
jgi:ADP-ribose pyrophosphatase